jgi:hypothetical protein
LHETLGFNDCVAVVSGSTKLKVVNYFYEDIHPDETNILITLKTCELNPEKFCVIDLEACEIRGIPSIESETIRDSMRRYGIILEPCGHYEPMKLNPFHLKEASIER